MFPSCSEQGSMGSPVPYSPSDWDMDVQQELLARTKDLRNHPHGYHETGFITIGRAPCVVTFRGGRWCQMTGQDWAWVQL